MEISSSSGIVFRRPIPCGSVDNQFHSSSSSSSSKPKLLLIGVPSSTSTSTSTSTPTPTPTPTPTRRRVFNKLTLSLQPSPSPSPLPSRIITKFSTSAAFSDTGHLNYYHPPAVRCGKHDDKNKNKNKNKNKTTTTTTTTKKKLKFLKALSKDLSMFSDSGFGVDPYNAFFGQLQGNIVSEAADALLRQLQQVRAEEKELKRKKKLDKAQLKATRMTTMLHSAESSSSSGSSDSECGEVIQMSRLIRKEKEKEAFVQPIIVHELEAGTLEESTSTLPSSLTCCSRSISTTENHAAVQCCSESSSSNVVCDGGNGLVTGLSSKRIEVCMGGKCKKSGGAELLEEFERAIGSSNVVGCKCMGKCKDGPNVRVLNCFDVVEAQGLHDDSVRTPTNPLCIGVGLADVGVILANFFGEDGSFAPAV